MKFKKRFIVICLIICLFAMASVSASDDDIAIQSGDDTLDEVIASDEADDNEITYTSDENDVLNAASFRILQEYIDGAPEGGHIILDQDYSIAVGGDTIKISKNITIKGDNHIVDGDNSKGLFSIEADGKNVVFLNVIFKNGKTSNKGGAIFNAHPSTSISFVDCQFTDNYASDGGGAIYNEGKLTVFQSKFDSNKANDDGGAILSKGEIRITQSEFNDNNAGDKYIINANGGAICSQSKCYIDSCTFNHNFAIVGAAINSTDVLTIVGPNRFHNQDTFYSTIRCDKDIYINWNSNNSDDVCEIDSETHKGLGAIESRGGNVYAKYLNIHDIEVNSHGKIGGAISVGDSDDELFGEVHISNSRFHNIKFRNLEGDPEVRVNIIAYGGAVWCWGDCYIESCSFDNCVATRGGAVYSRCSTVVSGQSNVFSSNKAANEAAAMQLFTPYGGGIYCEGDLKISNATFRNNKGSGDGAAVYCLGKTTIDNSYFENNYAGNLDGWYILPLSHWGGGVLSKGLLTLDSCEFKNNHADQWGGAVYADSELVMRNCNFTGNYANSAGAVYASTITQTVSNSIFTGNHADSGDGGAINIYHKCNPSFDSCTFEQNTAPKGDGGAIYMGSVYSYLKLSNCKFTNCSAKEGGAVYAHQLTSSLSNSVFIRNKATSGDGGAVYVKNNHPTDYSIKCEFTNSVFEENSCTGSGGAVYFGSKYAHMKISSSTFNDNTAKQGGAVYSHQITDVSNSVFLRNKATGDDGGALYIKNDDPNEFATHNTIISCRFEDNKCYGCGGAIYFGSKYPYLSVSYSTFVHNHADKKNYGVNEEDPENLYHGPGHSIFNMGNYELIEKCWFGTNSPDFSGQLVEHRTGANDRDHTPSNYLQIAMKINDTELYTGNDYLTTVYFISTDGNALAHNVFHSTGSFSGSAHFSNISADVNDMTAIANLFISGTYRLYGKLDDQEVSIEANVNEKQPCEVRITSCDNVQFPDQFRLTYEISSLSDDATIVIKNSQGEIVYQDSITSPSGELKKTFDGLGSPIVPGTYTVTITNPETKAYLAGSANATYTLSKGDFGLMIVAFNETYPDEAECIVYANVAVGLRYNLTVRDASGIVFSRIVDITERVAHFDIGVRDAGTYTATISFEGNEYYNPVSNSTTFEVRPQGTNFEIEINPSEIDYGNTATVTPIISPGATGTIKYFLDDGTFLGELSVDENLILPVFDAGSYVIIANYSGDRDSEPAFDSVHLIVNKAKTQFEIRPNASEITYGETATVIPVLPSGAKGTVRYYLSDGTLLGELGVRENLTLPVFNAGTYVIFADYSGDGNFLNATANTTVTVDKAKTAFEIETVNVSYGETATVTAILPDGAKGTIRYYLSDGALLGLLPVDEELNLYSWNAGSYVIFADYSGDENFLNATANTTLTINKAVTVMTATPVATVYNIDGYLVVTIEYINGKPVPGLVLTVDLNGAKNYTTDENGQIKVNVAKLVPKSYVAKITFAGNENYKQSSANATVTVKKAKPKIVAKTKTFKTLKKVKKYTITLKDNTGKAIKNAVVTLKIKGKTLKAKTNSKGKATFKITKFKKKGKYKAVITYKGNKYYTKVTKKVKIVIKITFKTVSRGSKDKVTVRKIQRALKDHGFYLSYKGRYLMVDGIFHSCTQRSVREFQHAAGLKVTGKVDETTALRLGIIKEF